MRHPWGETSAIQEDPINQRSGPNFRLACQSMADIFVSPGISGFLDRPKPHSATIKAAVLDSGSQLDQKCG